MKKHILLIAWSLLFLNSSARNLVAEKMGVTYPPTRAANFFQNYGNLNFSNNKQTTLTDVRKKNVYRVIDKTVTVGGYTHNDKTPETYALVPTAGLTENVMESSSSDLKYTSNLETSNIDYRNYQGTTLANISQCVSVFGLYVRDGGEGLNDSDNLPTSIASITFNIVKPANIRSARLFVGNSAAGVPIAVNGASSITFNNLTDVIAPDNTQVAIYLRVTFNSSVVDNDQMKFQVNSVTVNSNSSKFAKANGGGPTSNGSSATVNKIMVKADRMSFQQQPTDSFINAEMNPYPTILAIDNYGNRDLDYSKPVSIISTGTLSYPITANITNGIGVVSGVVHSNPGTSLYLKATANMLGNISSSLFKIKQLRTPLFDAIQPICSGNQVPNLPTNSLNGISGIWNPSVISNIATTIYTFTPNVGQNAVPVNLTIVVNEAITPTFDQVPAVLSGSAFSLPSTSLEEITGTWSPEVNNTVTTTYTFTPNQGQCATTTTMTVVIMPAPPSADDLPLSPGGKLENVFDRFGKNYSLREISTSAGSNTAGRSQMLCSSGIFELYFEAGSGMEGNSSAENARRAVVCQVFSDLSDFIKTPLHNSGNNTKVRIWVRDLSQITTSTSTLGIATGFYSVPASPNLVLGGILDNEIWKTIHTGVDSYTNVNNPMISSSDEDPSSGLFYHGMMAIKINTNWNTNLSTNATISNTDLYSVVLHELLHALGFASLIDFDGASKLGSAYNYYSRYDTFLKFNNQEIISASSANCSMMNNIFNADPAILTPGCTSLPPNNTGTPTDHSDCASTLVYDGTTTVPIYTASCFERSSSLSHFEDECFINTTTGVAFGNNSYFVMSNALSPGATKRYIKPEEKAALSDLGYGLNSTYGNSSQNSFFDYGFSSSGIGVAGVNDGISNNSYTFITSTDVPISITGILSNDVSFNSDFSVNNQSNLRFECLEDVYDSTALITSSGDDISANITFTASRSGVHLLRYVPYDILTGERGNITYIYVFVRAVFNNCGTPNTCNLVFNGDFEQFSQIPSQTGQLNRACGWRTGFAGNTPDYFFRDNNINSSQWANIPCNFIGYQESTTPLATNNGYAGFFIIGPGGNNIGSETIVNQLNTPLLPNTRYQLQLDLALSKESSSVKNIQIYFSNNEDLQIATTGILPGLAANNPMLFVTGLITNQNDWTHVTFDFTTGDTAGQNFMYIGGLTDVISQVIVPMPFTPCVGGDFNYNVLPNLSYYYIDNVSLVPLYEAELVLPEKLCAINNIPDLRNYLQSIPTNGVFTGEGVITHGTAPNFVYSFDPLGLDIGNYTISYTYAPTPGCPLITITDTIEVTICPEFYPIDPLCQGSVPPILPENPVNSPSLVGVWSPLEIDTTTAGTFTYIFTPNVGEITTVTATMSITILPSPDAGSLNGPAIVYQGANINLTPAHSGGVWSSSDVDIASVDNNGLVTGITAGSSIISYTLTGANTCTTSVESLITVLPVNSSCTGATIWNGSSWSNGVPNDSSYLNTEVIFAATFNTNEDLYACKVLVTNNATVTVEHVGLSDTTTANTITVANEVVVDPNSSLIFEDDTSLVQINNSTNSGNITYIRITPAVNKFDYTYWSSPVAEQSLYDLSPDTGTDKFYRWNPLINNWSYTPNSNIMTVGEGYIIRGPQYHDIGVTAYEGHFIGVPHNGEYTFPVLNSASTMNLIGNPYPSGLNIDCFLADPLNAHLGGTIHLWTHNIPIDWTGNTQQGFPGSAVYNYNVNSYISYNRLGGVGSGVTKIEDGVFSTDRPISVVAAGQSFFIESNATGVATFKNSMRVGSKNQENSQFFRSAGSSIYSPCASDDRHRLWLHIRNMTPAQQFKQTLIGYSPSATTSNSLDREYDARTFLSAPFNINLYSLSPGNEHLTIQGRHLSNPFDANDIIPLGFTCIRNTSAATNTIEIAASEFDGLFLGSNFYLRITQPDSTYVYHDIKASPYQFVISGDVVDDVTKFAIVFLVPPGGIMIKTPIKTSDFFVSMSPNPFDKSFSLNVQSPINDDITISIYDVLGKQLSNESLSIEMVKNTIFERVLASGVYYAVITQGPYKQTLKIVKK